MTSTGTGPLVLNYFGPTRSKAWWTLLGCSATRLSAWLLSSHSSLIVSTLNLLVVLLAHSLASHLKDKIACPPLHCLIPAELCDI